MGGKVSWQPAGELPGVRERQAETGLLVLGEHDGAWITGLQLPFGPWHLQVHAGVLHDQHCQGGDVYASIALPRQEKFVVLVLRKEAEEIFEGLVVVLGNLGAAGRRLSVRLCSPSEGITLLVQA